MNEIVPIKFHSVSCNNIKNKTEFVNSWGGAEIGIVILSSVTTREQQYSTYFPYTFRLTVQQTDMK